MKDDPELRELFEASRQEDEVSAPRLEELLARRSRRDRDASAIAIPPRFAVALVAAILLALTVMIARRPRLPAATTDAPAVAFFSVPRWKAPTDFLLDTPGRELFAGTPRIEAPPLPHDGSSEPKKGTRT